MARKADKRAKKIKRRGRRRFVFSVILLTSVILVGGSFLAVLLYLYFNGILGTVFQLIKDVFLYREIDVALFAFWALAVPLLLIILLIVNAVRRSKFRYYRKTWEETVQLAVDAEKKAFEAELDKKRRTNRFSQLKEIGVKPLPEGGSVSTLEELCTRFRAFAATNLHLYYTEAQIREFVAGMAVSHILILQGMSGTGKTSLTYAFGEFVGNPATIVPVQPMWKERSDLLGYFNEFTRKYNETELLRKMYEANESEAMFVTVLDEVNIARVEYYFAEFLSLLEIPNPEARYLEVVPDTWEDDPAGLKDGRIKLPENMWFVGTANNDDSTFAISDKVYDRAMIVNLDTRATPFGGDVPERIVPVSYKAFTELVKRAQDGYEITRRNERRLKELDEYLVQKFRISFGNRIMRQIRGYLAVYVACGGDELDALDDILAKKVFRKLAYKDLTLLRGEMEGAAKFLRELFGEDKMPQCCAMLSSAARE